jgi:hypothetical protein
MRFIKKRLSNFESPILSAGTMGIPNHRLPVPEEREWAVSDDGKVFFVQLQSNSWEMREGRYWYILILPRQTFVISIYAYAGIEIDGMHFQSAHFDPPATFEKYSFELISRLVNEAVRIVCNDKRGVFIHTPARPCGHPL